MFSRLLHQRTSLESHPKWHLEADIRKEQIVGTTSLSDWSPAQDALLKSSAAVLRNNPRCSCLITSIINKPCAEVILPFCPNFLVIESLSGQIRHMLVLEELLPEPVASAPADGTKDPEAKQGVKRKKFPVSALPGYPSDCDRTHTHERRTAFQACRHLGQCTGSCPCVQSHVTCEKS